MNKDSFGLVSRRFSEIAKMIGAASPFPLFPFFSRANFRSNLYPQGGILQIDGTLWAIPKVDSSVAFEGILRMMRNIYCATWTGARGRWRCTRNSNLHYTPSPITCDKLFSRHFLSLVHRRDFHDGYDLEDRLTAMPDSSQCTRVDIRKNLME